MKPYAQGSLATALPIPTTLDEMVFEYRNKAYGAYELRKGYSSNLNKAIFIGVSCFLLMLLTNFIFARQKEKGDVLLHEYNPIDYMEESLPPIEKPKDPEPPKIEQKSSITYVEPVVVEETTHESPPPSPDEMEGKIISNVTIKGIDSDEIAATPPPARTSETVAVELPVEDNTPFLTVEVNPSFLGGNSEMYKFLGKNLKYPNAAQRANIQGKVFLSFIVEKDGSITDISTLKGIGFGCDEEAIRVMKLMPNWIVGKQNGRNVRVKFTIPVFFKLED